jgi:hypothetical protein
MSVKYINVFQYKALQKFSQIGIFGLKINHLATLLHINEREPSGKKHFIEGPATTRDFRRSTKEEEEEEVKSIQQE